MPGAIGSKADPQVQTPTTTPTSTVSTVSLEGTRFDFQSATERDQAIDQAVDYRGDVTLHLSSGEAIEVYLYNYNRRATPPVVDFFTKGSDESRSLPVSELKAMSFTGKDNAFGKSWQDWVSKKKHERQAEAARLAEGLKQQGYL